MPELAESPPTPQQAQITKITNDAVVDTSLDAGFDAEVDAAIARDAGETVREAPEHKETKAPKETKAEKPAAPAKVVDIPDVLLAQKKAEVKAEADLEREKSIKEQTAGMSTKAADRFRAIEAKAHAAEQKAARAEKLESELNEVREKLKSALDPTVADELKKQVSELDEIVNKNAIAEHPRFKAKYDAQIAKEVATAAKLVPKEAAGEVEALLSLPETAQRNRRLNEIADELDNVAQKKFLNAVDLADRLSSERAGEIANWKVNKMRLAELSEQEKSQAVEHQTRTVEKALKSVLPKFTSEENGVELFRKVDGNEEWNKVVEARLENVRKLTAAELSKEDTAEMAAWAISGSEYRKLFLTQRVLVARLQEEIATLKSGEPDFGTGTGEGGDDDEKGSMVDIIARMAQKSGALR